jgi:predicted kinase
MAALLVVFAGLPGTGKSTLARAIAQRLGATWLRVDVAEAAMLKAGLSRSFETGLAAYIVARDIAADHLRLGQPVVVDAVNSVGPARAMWRDLRAECGASLFFVEAICSNGAEHRRRVETREGPTPPLPVPTWPEVLEREYQAWNEPILQIDTIEPVDHCVAQILRRVSGAGTPS